MLTAKNIAELEKALKSIDISVPKRSEGRTTEHTEQHDIVVLLNALSNTNKLSYPIELIKRERPDFLLKASGVEVGIKHTEAVPQNSAHKSVLRDKLEGASQIHFITRSVPGEARKTAKELTEEIQSEKVGAGWAGDSPEREWAEAIMFFIVNKLQGFKKTGFKAFQKNWLLIYDNWPLPALDYQKATELLLLEVKKTNYFATHEKVHIISSGVVHTLTTKGIEQYKINGQ